MKMTMGVVILATAASLLVIGAACGGSGGVEVVERAPGQQLYLDNCAVCHGARGEGQPNWQILQPDGTFPPPPHDSSGHTWHHGDGTLFRYVKKGGAAFNIPGFVSGMPAFGDKLSDQEIIEVLLYIEGFWGPQEKAHQDSVSEQDPFPTAP